MLAEMKPSAFARHYPEGQARNTAIARHATAKIRQQHEQMGFHEGWGIVLDQLVHNPVPNLTLGCVGPRKRSAAGRDDKRDQVEGDLSARATLILRVMEFPSLSTYRFGQILSGEVFSA